MAGDLFVLGLSWRTADVAVRERVAFRDDEIDAGLGELLSSQVIGEAMILSTCNRVEIYAATPRGAPASVMTAATAEARRFIAQSRATPAEELAEALYERTDIEAVRHAFRVASALDSMVVGEAQILGQLKSAFGAANRAGATGPVLRRCFEKAFGVAKRVRSETGIARGAANVSSVAVELARHVFGELAGKTVAVIGAGKMSDLAARHLRADGAGSVLVTNRSPEKAAEVAARVDGVARPWEELDALLALADVVISSTGSQEPILTKKLVKAAMKKRRYRPQVIVDIAVPRDVAPDVGKIDGVYLFNIDDLERAVAVNLEERAREAEDASEIVEREVHQFGRWLDTQSVVPTIRALRAHFAAIAREEAEKVVASLDGKSQAQQEAAVRRLGDVIVNKLLHQPMNALKGGDGTLGSDALVAAARQLFDLADEDAADQAADRDGAATAPTPALAERSKNRG